MDALMIVVMAGIFLWGYIIVSRVDKFISKDSLNCSIKGKRRMGLLIFGSYDAVCEARREGIQYTELTEPVLPENEDYYSAILLLSKNDDENLELCRAVSKYDPDILIIVKCENANLRDVFKELGADRVILPDESTKMVLTEVWRAMKCAKKDY